MHPNRPLAVAKVMSQEGHAANEYRREIISSILPKSDQAQRCGRVADEVKGEHESIGSSTVVATSHALLPARRNFEHPFRVAALHPSCVR